jgi:hypothetical protein
MLSTDEVVLYAAKRSERLFGPFATQAGQDPVTISRNGRWLLYQGLNSHYNLVDLRTGWTMGLGDNAAELSLDGQFMAQWHGPPSTGIGGSTSVGHYRLLNLSTGHWHDLGTRNYEWSWITWSASGDRLTWQITAIGDHGKHRQVTAPTFATAPADNPSRVTYTRVRARDWLFGEHIFAVGAPAWAPDDHSLLYFIWEGPRHERYWDLMERVAGSANTRRLARLIVYQPKEGGPSAPSPLVLGRTIVCQACSSSAGLDVPYLIGAKVRYFRDNGDDYEYLAPNKPVLVSWITYNAQGQSVGQYGTWTPGEPTSHTVGAGLGAFWIVGRRPSRIARPSWEVPAYPFPSIRHVRGLRRIPFIKNTQLDAIDGNAIVYSKESGKKRSLFLASLSRAAVGTSRRIPDSSNEIELAGISRRWVVWENQPPGNGPPTLSAYNRTSGKARRLTLPVPLITWAMSGNEVIVASNGAVGIINLDSGTRRLVARVPGGCQPLQPAVSGSLIAFSELTQPTCKSGEIVAMDLMTRRIAATPLAYGSDSYIEAGHGLVTWTTQAGPDAAPCAKFLQCSGAGKIVALRIATGRMFDVSYGYHGWDSHCLGGVHHRVDFCTAGAEFGTEMSDQLLTWSTNGANGDTVVARDLRTGAQYLVYGPSGKSSVFWPVPFSGRTIAWQEYNGTIDVTTVP